MSVPVRDNRMLRYALAALCLAGAAIAFAMLPAGADCGACQAPPPPPHCDCNHAPIVVPSPTLSRPNVVMMNNSNASAQANAQSFAVSVARTGDVVVRTGGVAADVSVSAGVMAESSEMFAVVDRSSAASASTGERLVRVQGVCRDTGNVTHAALPTFEGEAVAQEYAGELFRCPSSAQTMRVSMDGHAADCAAGQALWYERGQLICKQPSNVRGVGASPGTGYKLVLLRDTTQRAPNETRFNAVAAMDGGVGAGFN